MLPVLPSEQVVNQAMQVRLLDALWTSGVTAFFLRFVASAARTDVSIFLLCRISPFNKPVLSRDDCAVVARRVQQLFKECGYTLVSIVDETLLDFALQPFPVHALAEIRRSEELFLLQDAYTRFEMYTTHPWEWTSELPLRFLPALSQLQRNNCLVSVSLVPTRLTAAEECLLDRATSPQVLNLLEGGGSKGQNIYSIYSMFAENLQRPFLLRICLAATTQQMVTALGRTLLNDLMASQSGPVLQLPNNVNEWQAAYHHLSALEWAPWGNMRDHEPDTARMRYLVDSEGASMGFHLPIVPEPATSRTQKIRVLLVFADPRNVGTTHVQRPLGLGMEDRVIQEAIKLSRYRENIEVKVLHAATIHDLRRALLENDFHIVHIAGHGARDGLILQDELGRPFRVPPQALADLFTAYNATLSCVVLNACYGLAQGELIALGVDFTIAMEDAIDDDAAREFARGFYDALGAGKEIGFAYGEGCRSARLAVPGVVFTPRLLERTG
jgi:hypothetical protein